MEVTKISIVIPVYNSQECLLPLTNKLENTLSYFQDYEIIFVNDNSTDNSWEVITQLCSKNEKIYGVTFRKNFGQDNAILAGLREATGDYSVIMDDDLQHSPEDIIILYNKCKEGFDICYANFHDKKQKGWKNFGSWLNGKLSEKLLDKPADIYLSPYKIIKKEVVDEVIKFSGPFPYIDATLLTITSNFSQIDVNHYDRHTGIGNYNFIRSLRVFIKHATNYSIYPLRLVTMVGFCTALISFIIGIFYIIQYFFNNNRVEGWITIVILLIFFGGLILMSLGLIGEYVGRIFLSINNKPQYIIKGKINKNKKIK
jgi:glycosyltransferase involved in cell wall biosynthesis